MIKQLHERFLCDVSKFPERHFENLFPSIARFHGCANDPLPFRDSDGLFLRSFEDLQAFPPYFILFAFMFKGKKKNIQLISVLPESVHHSLI
jgi:hypothetical protein